MICVNIEAEWRKSTIPTVEYSEATFMIEFKEWALTKGTDLKGYRADGKRICFQQDSGLFILLHKGIKIKLPHYIFRIK